MTHPAQKTLNEFAQPQLAERIEAAVKLGNAWWRRDPVNRGVYALFIGDVTAVIVYTDGFCDFEVADDIEDLLVRAT